MCGFLPLIVSSLCTDVWGLRASMIFCLMRESSDIRRSTTKRRSEFLQYTMSRHGPTRYPRLRACFVRQSHENPQRLSSPGRAPARLWSRRDRHRDGCPGLIWGDLLECDRFRCRSCAAPGGEHRRAGGWANRGRCAGQGGVPARLRQAPRGAMRHNLGSELLEEAQITGVKPANVIDAVAHHAKALHS